MPMLMPSDLLRGLQDVMGDPLADELRRQQIQAQPGEREAQALANRANTLKLENLRKFLTGAQGMFAESPYAAPAPGAPVLGPLSAGAAHPPMMERAAPIAPAAAPESLTTRLLKLGVETGQTSPETFVEAMRPAAPKPGAEDPALVAKYEQFLTQVDPLLKTVKRDPAVITDIALAGEKMGLGPLKRYQDFINNVKGLNPFQMQQQTTAAGNRVVDLAWKYATQTDKQRTLVPGVKAVDAFFKDAGVPGGMYGSMDEITKATPPGYGLGERGFRNWVKSDDATEFRSNILAIHAAWRNQLFGASLSEGERKAFEELSGTGSISNAKDLISGIRNLNAGLRENLRPVGGDEVMNELRNSGISTFEQLPEPPKKAPKAAAAPGAGTTVWRRAKDGKEYEYNSATKEPTGRSR